MNKIINCFMLFFMIQLFSGCYAQKNCNTCGVVVVKERFFDTATNKYVLMANSRDWNIWYKDSLVIQEVLHIYQNEDPKGEITFRVEVERYKFINLRTREIYEYKNFSDTAGIIKKCLPNDSSCIGECWKFWNNYDMFKGLTVYRISDTLINGITYSRLKSSENIITEKGKLLFTRIAYLRCDIKWPLIRFSPGTSRDKRCAIVKFEELNQPKIYTDAYAEIEYLPRPLSQNELRIFLAWEKNAKNYR
jgi:hypothetical protein